VLQHLEHCCYLVEVVLSLLLVYHCIPLTRLPANHLSAAVVVVPVAFLLANAPDEVANLVPSHQETTAAPEVYLEVVAHLVVHVEVCHEDGDMVRMVLGDLVVFDHKDGEGASCL